jgi:hypothetical protein
MTQVKYVEDRRTSLTAAELAGFTVGLESDGYDVIAVHISGECPRCHHATQATVTVARVATETTGPFEQLSLTKAVSDHLRSVITMLPRGHVGSTIHVTGAAAAPGGVATPPPTPPAGAAGALPVVLACHCAVPHPKSGGKFGCGRSWMLGVAFNPHSAGAGATLHLPSQEDLASWADIVAQSSSDAGDPLVPVQEFADKWQKALAALFGIVGIASIVSRDSVSKMGWYWPEILTGCVLGVLVLTALAAYVASDASIGFPAITAVASPEDRERLAVDRFHQAKAAIKRLKISAVISGVAFAASLLALAGVLLAPSAQPDTSTKVAIRIKGAAPACVTVLPAEKPGMLRYADDNGDAQEVAFADLSQVTGPC